MICEVKLAVKTITALLLVVFAQTVVTAQSHQSEAERTVATLLADNGLAPLPGFVDTLVTRLGDGAAVGVIQYLGARKANVSEDLTSPQEISRILYIIRTAFAAPKIIEADENRSPKATLVLLKYLSCLPAAAAVKTDLESTTSFIEQLKLADAKNEATSYQK